MNATPRILIACIGNIFLGDDAFGVHVAEKLADVSLAANVRVIDFGIRGIDLTYALLDCDVAILVDAAPRGEKPGTLYLIEPEISDEDGADLFDAHSLDPVRVLQNVFAMGGRLDRVLLVGCEPAPLDGDSDSDMFGKLSAPVAAAIEPAVEMIQKLVAEIDQNPTATEVHHEDIRTPA